MLTIPINTILRSSSSISQSADESEQKRRMGCLYGRAFGEGEGTERAEECWRAEAVSQ